VELPQPVSPMTATMPMRARRHENACVRREVRPFKLVPPDFLATADSLAFIFVDSPLTPAAWDSPSRTSRGLPHDSMTRSCTVHREQASDHKLVGLLVVPVRKQVLAQSGFGGLLAWVVDDEVAR
jgi:hypothetical protein